MTRLQQFEEIVRQYQAEMINFHYRFVNNRFEAEDLAQETFIKAYKKMHTLKKNDKFRGWLFMIARNTVIDFFRKNKNREIPIEQAYLENLSETTRADYQEKLANLETSKELERCIDQLVREDRAVVKLLYYEGFSYREIGDLLGIKQNTLKSRLHRARKVLLAAIKESKILKETVLEYSANN